MKHCTASARVRLLALSLVEAKRRVRLNEQIYCGDLGQGFGHGFRYLAVFIVHEAQNGLHGYSHRAAYWPDFVSRSSEARPSHARFRSSYRWTCGFDWLCFVGAPQQGELTSLGQQEDCGEHKHGNHY